MASTDFDYKINVFISSKCDAKYTIARKALKSILQATGFIQAYAFESEPASSDDTRSSYLQYVDMSDVCIFLVDNADGVPAAVLSEEKRAIDKNIKRLYFFCDEKSKEITAMQNMVKASLSQKYVVVHEFADMVPEVYESLMRDLIVLYKKKDSKLPDDIQTDSNDKNAIVQNQKGLLVLNSTVVDSEKISCTIKKKVLAGVQDKLVECSETEKCFARHLETILYQKAFDDSVLDGIRDSIIKLHPDYLSDIIKIRFKAQHYYYSAMLDDCLTELKKAIKLALESDTVPEWIINDIAIDIRNVCIQIDEINNKYQLNNIGQQYIDKSNEPVYYPVLDRKSENIYSKIVEHYYTKLNISPYSNYYGGIEFIITDLVKAYCIAETYGSIVQTEYTRERLIDIYSMLCTLYTDHDLYLEYIRLLIINRKNKQLDNVLRTFKMASEFLNNDDINDILKSISYIKSEIYKAQSKFILVSRLGYYMNDSSYEIACDDLFEFTNSWLEDTKHIMQVKKCIFDFLKMNIQRIPINEVMRFVFHIFDKGLFAFFDDCFKLLADINFNKVSKPDQERVRQLFIDILYNSEKCNQLYYLENAIIAYCKSTTVSYEELSEVLKGKKPSFYNGTYKLEILSQTENDSLDFIYKYIDEANSRNLVQGKNGIYSGYTYEPFDIIGNIIRIDKVHLDDKNINLIVDAVIGTLESKTQTVRAKESAIQLVQLLWLVYRDCYRWDDVFAIMYDNQEVYSTGYEEGFLEKNNNYTLLFTYVLFMSNKYKEFKENVIELIYKANSDTSYINIRLLQIIKQFLVDSNQLSLDYKLLWAFLYFAISASHNKEKDIRCLATICILLLAKYKQMRHICVNQVYQIMKNGTYLEKIVIMKHIDALQLNKRQKRDIINIGMADSHYLVRKATEKCD